MLNKFISVGCMVWLWCRLFQIPESLKILIKFETHCRQFNPRRLINYLISILDSLENLNQNCRYQNQVASYTLVLVIRDNCWRIYNSFLAHLPPNYCLQFRIRVKLASHFLCPHIDIDHRDSTSKKINRNIKRVSFRKTTLRFVSRFSRSSDVCWRIWLFTYLFTFLLTFLFFNKNI